MSPACLRWSLFLEPYLPIYGPVNFQLPLVFWHNTLSVCSEVSNVKAVTVKTASEPQGTAECVLHGLSDLCPFHFGLKSHWNAWSHPCLLDIRTKCPGTHGLVCSRDSTGDSWETAHSCLRGCGGIRRKCLRPGMAAVLLDQLLLCHLSWNAVAQNKLKKSTVCF